MRFPGLKRILFFSCCFCAHGAEPAEVAPAPLMAARYDTMIKKSPFAPATAAATPPPAAPSFTTNYYISGIARIGDTDFVTVVSRSDQSRFSLAPGESGPEAITVSKVEWSDDLGKSKVTMKKGGEVGVVEFDQAATQKGVAVAPPPVPGAQNRPNIPMPPQPGNNGGQHFPGQNGPNRQRAGYPQGTPATAAGYPQAVQPPPGSTPFDTRRRIRIINSKPPQ